MNLWHLYIYDCYNFVLFQLCIYVSELCFKHVYACVYIFCPCSCVRYPQLKSIYCGMVRLVVFRLPEYLYYLQHCIDGIFNLRLPPMYSIVIIPCCFMFCMFLCKFHVLWARATCCFQMPTLRFQHWVFPSQDVFMNLWHLYICLYMFVLIQSVLFCIRGCHGCSRLNLLCHCGCIYNLLYFIIVQYVFVRFSPFRYVDVNGSSIAI